ncbi:MAG TPA: proline dehydrogenase family protein [Longimicrobiales bacterium]
MLRNVLLRASQSEWLEERLPRLWFTRAAVRRFMPGEDLDAALRAARELGERRIATVLTELGENVTDAAEADAVAEHYTEVLERIAQERLDTEISVKLTQLGLDIGTEQTAARLEKIVTAAEARGVAVWIDMESSQYTDRTLELYQAARARHANVGVCMQANMLRTSRDLETLLERDAAIRLVKGAYREPASRAFQSRRDIDKNYLRLADRLLREKAQRGSALRIAFGTHDVPLVRRITEMARLVGVSTDAFEVQMLYGIRTSDQERLAGEGYRLRVLISYGSAWYPWFMRRLAERPANLMLVARNLVRV